MLDYADEVESDLSAFHRVEYAGDLEAAVFYSRSLLLPAYHGALYGAITRETAAAPGDETIGGAVSGDDPDNLRARRQLLADLSTSGEPIQWVDHDTLIREATT